jgi:hypothetical protein
MEPDCPETKPAIRIKMAHSFATAKTSCSLPEDFVLRYEIRVNRHSRKILQHFTPNFSNG